MKIKYTHLAWWSLLWGLLVTPALAQCSITGVWRDDLGYLWDLEQDESGPITGTADFGLIQCPEPIWDVGGAVEGTRFRARASNPTQGDSECVVWLEYEGVIAEPACRTGAGTWRTSEGNRGRWNWTRVDP